MTRGKYIHKHMVLQCSKHFHSKVWAGFLQQHLQSSHSFGKIKNLGVLEISEEKTLCFIDEKFHISSSLIFSG